MNYTNVVRMKAVSNALADLKDKVVFVGGATVSLYPDRPIFEIRPTDDVDVIIEILSYAERAALEDKLRLIGFENDTESSVVCRFKIQGIVVDVMPTNDPSIGFSNKWYPEGFKTAIDYSLDDTNIVKILSPPYFLATKLEAFKSRGNEDGRTSHDFEDIVFVLENRKQIWNELAALSGTIAHYLRSEFILLLSNQHIAEWIDSHVERTSPPKTSYIIQEMRKFCYTTDKRNS